MSLRKSLFVAEVGMFYVYITEPRGYGANLYGFTYPQRLPFMVRRHGGKIKPMGVYYEKAYFLFIFFRRLRAIASRLRGADIDVPGRWIDAFNDRRFSMVAE